MTSRQQQTQRTLLDGLGVEYATEKPSNKLLAVTDLGSDTWVTSEGVSVSAYFTASMRSCKTKPLMADSAWHRHLLVQLTTEPRHLSCIAWPLGRCRPPMLLAMGQNREKLGKNYLLTPSARSGRMGLQ